MSLWFVPPPRWEECILEYILPTKPERADNLGVVNQPKNFGVSLSGVYRQFAVAYTDFWESYKTVIPSKRHRPVGKETGQTNPIESCLAFYP